MVKAACMLTPAPAAPADAAAVGFEEEGSEALRGEAFRR
tara:strand:- start:1213 stop:1329 length:117 start_codon:yes stop_codon:yes gene_type:complete